MPSPYTEHHTGGRPCQRPLRQLSGRERIPGAARTTAEGAAIPVHEKPRPILCPASRRRFNSRNPLPLSMRCRNLPAEGADQRKKYLFLPRCFAAYRASSAFLYASVKLRLSEQEVTPILHDTLGTPGISARAIFPQAIFAKLSIF